MIESLQFPVGGLHLGWREKLHIMFMATFRSEDYGKQVQDFAQIASENERLIAGICLSFARSREDFEDMRQDVMLNVWRGLKQFRSDSVISTWIYRVALNTCVSYRRQARKQDQLSFNELIAELYDNSSVEQQSRYALMYSMIGRLKPLDKSIVLMWLDEKSYEEIADVMGMTRDAVASRLKRAKESLSQMRQQSISTI